MKSSGGPHRIRAAHRAWPRARGALAAALVLALAACATPQADSARRPDATARLRIRAAHEIAAVPFYAQERAQCGPATLAMALSRSGPAQTPDALRDLVFTPGRDGSFTIEMVAAARRRGRLAVVLEPSLDAVLREVDGGQPVIVLLNLGLAIFPVWHYALVIGYDLPADRIVLHSGPDPRAAMSLELFERTWARGGRWAMVAAAPEAPPRTPAPDALADAAAALERVDVPAARRAYDAILRRDPRHFGAWMGLGNCDFALGDSAGAAHDFVQAGSLQPDNGDAWNNLATARSAQGQVAGARDAVARARAAGGPHRQLYEQTAAEIERAAAAR